MSKKKCTAGLVGNAVVLIVLMIFFFAEQDIKEEAIIMSDESKKDTLKIELLKHVTGGIDSNEDSQNQDVIPDVELQKSIRGETTLCPKCGRPNCIYVAASDKYICRSCGFGT